MFERGNCGKLSYNNREEAEEDIIRVKEKYGGEYKVYLCFVCMKWHLTKNKK